MEENFYVRGDGTRVYFFEKEELEEIWGGKERPAQPKESETNGHEADEESTSSPPAQQLSELSLNGSGPLEGDQKTPEQPSGAEATPSPQSPRPAFEIVHFGIDRRMLVNRQRRLKMYRCWMQAVFRKPGHQSEVPTSTLRQDKEKEVVEGEGDEA